MFYRGGRHCIFMLQTKTNINTMVYRIKNKLDFKVYFVWEIMYFLLFFPCWVGCLKPVFKHEYCIKKQFLFL